ncbi:hypothetical protein MAQ5080_02519 [Marinomonas aquimarina]|uniref:Uncharacterized protein n=1 Tax=Marinomonas aquimarina TaxID=295068 RepID=A0A1A8THY3_9GAMM|nr:hypothetical protein MAQ5080_02519 [Marinomonas aquimarina]
MKLLGIVIVSAAVMDMGKLAWVVSELPCNVL